MSSTSPVDQETSNIFYILQMEIEAHIGPEKSPGSQVGIKREQITHQGRAN